jgi:hypothetical protein
MSHVYQLKCDRCSAIEDYDSDKTRKWASVRAWRNRRRQKDGSSSSDASLDVDLCRACADGFSEWLGEAAKWNSAAAA